MAFLIVKSPAVVVVQMLLENRSKLMGKHFASFSVFVCMCRLSTVCVDTPNYCHLSQFKDAMFGIITTLWRSHSVILALSHEW